MPESAHRKSSARGDVVSSGADRLTKVLTGAVQGAGEIAAELGVTASSAVRGSIRAVEQIGGDLFAVTRSAIEGGLNAAGRISAAADRAARRMADNAGLASTARSPKIRATRSGSRKRKAGKRD
jgi:hypothetical protein